MEVLLHSANVIYLVSYVMRDILWLRFFTIVAAILLIIYFYFLPEPLLTPVYWNLLFVSLNVIWVSRLLLERRPVQLTADEQQLCELVFRLVSPREMINLLRIGKWQAADVDDCLVQAGEQLDSLMLIHSGLVCYLVNGEKTQMFGPGQFVGSISFVTGETAPADIVVLEPTRFVSWKKGSLRKYLGRNPELHAAIQATLGIDLSKKLEASWLQSQSPV